MIDNIMITINSINGISADPMLSLSNAPFPEWALRAPLWGNVVVVIVIVIVIVIVTYIYIYIYIVIVIV